jgi:hypothetical protein
MDDQKILDNAPKCNTATHVDNEGDYYKIQVEYQYEDESDCGYEQMFKLNHLKNWEVDDCVLILMRSLADIKELVELRNANAELMKGYEELRITALHAVCKIGGGQAKADLRDAYDKATEQLEKLKAGS